MKRTLQNLSTRRTSLACEIATLSEDLNKAPLLRKMVIARELAGKQIELRHIHADIACVVPELDRLEIQWDDSNVANVPVTVI